MVEEDKGGALKFLRNAETLLVAVILAIILWVGQTTYNNSIILTKLVTQVDHLVENQNDIGRETDVDQLRLEARVSLIAQRAESSIDEMNKRFEERLATIWPRLREIKERTQHLESISKDERASEPWKY